MVPRLCDSSGGGVSATVLQRGQLLGQEQRVGPQQVLYRPQVSTTWKYNNVSQGENTTPGLHAALAEKIEVLFSMLHALLQINLIDTVNTHRPTVNQPAGKNSPDKFPILRIICQKRQGPVGVETCSAIYEI